MINKLLVIQVKKQKILIILLIEFVDKVHTGDINGEEYKQKQDPLRI